MLTPTARPHLLGCCITTPLRSETYLAGFFQGYLNAHQEAQMPCPSAFTQWFIFLTRKMPLGPRVYAILPGAILPAMGGSSLQVGE